MMRIKKYFYFILMSVGMSLFCQEYNEYELILEKTYSANNSKNFGVYFPGYEIGVNGPSGIGFLSSGESIVIDNILKRICHLDQEYNIRSCWDNDPLPGLSGVIVSEEMINLSTGRRFQRFSLNGDLYIHVEFSFSEERNIVYSYFVFGEVLFIYKNNTLLSIPNPGPDPEANNRKILDSRQTRELFKEPAKYGLEDVTLDSSNRLFVNGELQTRDYKTFIQYWMEHYSISSFQSYRNLNIHDKKPIHFDSTGSSYIGEDVKGNVYWNNFAVNYVLVFNNGKCIDKLKYESKKSKTSPAVHPSGDIYFLSYDINAVYLYRIKNVWDPKSRENWYVLNGGESNDEQPSTKVGLLNDSRVRFRTEPNLTSETLGYLNKGDRVLVLEQSAEKMQIGDMNDYWYHIRTADGIEGWAYGYFIDVNE